MYLFHNLLIWFSILSAMSRVQHFLTLSKHNLFLQQHVAEVCYLKKRAMLLQPEQEEAVQIANSAKSTEIYLLHIFSCRILERPEISIS